MYGVELISIGTGLQSPGITFIALYRTWFNGVMQAFMYIVSVPHAYMKSQNWCIRVPCMPYITWLLCVRFYEVVFVEDRPADK